MTPRELARRINDLSSTAGVTLAVLHGSRARCAARLDSDWDIGVLAGLQPDLLALTADIAAIVGTDAIDVVDLRTASALLRFRAARDGVALIERPPGTFEAFQLDAVEFWCDAGPVIRAAQEDVLAGLG